MKEMDIHILLQRYWDGETSIEEERRIKAYFAANEGIDASVSHLKPWFAALETERAVQLPAEPVLQVQRRAPLLRYLAAATVAGLIGLGAWWANTHFSERSATASGPDILYKDSYEDPEQAVAEIKAALALVSSKLNKGKREAAKGLKKVEAVDRYFKVKSK
jgi:hypothetical protein